MNEPENMLPRLQRTLEEILQSVPLVSHVSFNLAPVPLAKNQVDLLVTVTLSNSTRHELAVEFKQQGHPRQLREALNQILLYRHHGQALNAQLVPVVAAPFITEEGAALCREENINFCDIAGNCRLNFGGLFIERAGRSNVVQRANATPDLYAPRSERILRVLLENPLQSWKVAPLAKEAKVSLGTVSTVRKLLLAHEWARETDDGFSLIRADRLLQDWAGVWARRRLTVRGYLSLDGVNTTESRLMEAAHALSPDTQFAITGLSAAWRHAQWVRYERVQAYWKGDPAELARHAKLKPADSGANVQLIVPRDVGVFHGVIGIAGIPVVSKIQTYLDLKREPARGAEAAEFLWNTVLFPGHATKQ